MKREERAQQVWQVLVSSAHNHQIITYGALAELIEMGPGTLAGPLGCVMHYCEQNRFPPLTALVVQKKLGKPGEGLTSVNPKTLDANRQKVFAFRWFERIPPSAQDFADAYAGG